MSPGRTAFGIMDCLGACFGVGVISRMGVHQFKLTLVPKERFRCPATVTEDEVDRIESEPGGWWALRQPAPETLDCLRQLCPNDKSWGETEEYRTSETWGSDLRIWKENERVWLVTFRYSPASDDLALLQRFAEIAREERCLLLDVQTGVLFEPDGETVMKHLRESRAMRFVSDPTGAIVDATKDTPQEEE